MKAPRLPVVLLVSVFLAIACDGRGPAAPTPQPRQAVAFTLTGVVADDDRRPMAGATVEIDFVASEQSVSHASVVTNGLGVYTIDFTAVPGARGILLKGPVVRNDTVALAWVRARGCEGPADDPQPACGYDLDSRYIFSTTQRVTQDFHLHRATRITAGESTELTITPDDRNCGLDIFDSICRTVRIVAPSDGVMRVGAVAAQAGSAVAGIEAMTLGLEFTGNPTSIPIVTRTEVVANLKIPWNATASQSFVVQTSMSLK